MRPVHMIGHILERQYVLDASEILPNLGVLCTCCHAWPQEYIRPKWRFPIPWRTVNVFSLTHTSHDHHTPHTLYPALYTNVDKAAE